MDDGTDDLADAPRYPHRQRDAEWVSQARAGSDRAFGQLYDAWFDRVFDLTQRIVRNREVALEVTQDAFLSAWRNLHTLEDPASFGGWLLRIARNGALNRQQKELRSVPVDEQDFAVMEATGGSPTNAPSGFALEDGLANATDPERALEDAETRDLVWQAASALGERDTEVLNLQLRHGLSPAEVGEVLGMNRNAANQLVHRVRGRFEVALRARLLWRNDKPACADLARLLASAGVEGFSVEAVKIADKHAPACPACAERRKSRLAPAAMFGAIPVMAAPIVFKQQAAYALEQAGVPMGGSAFGPASLTGSSTTDPDVDPTGDGGSASAAAGAAGGSHQLGRRAAAMAVVGVVVVVALLAVVTGRLNDQATNEVVALASGTAVGTSPASSALGTVAPASTTDDPGSGSTETSTDPGVTTDSTATSPPSSSVRPAPTNTTPPPASDPGPAPGPTVIASPGPTIGGPGISVVPGPTVTSTTPPLRISFALDKSLAKTSYTMRPGAILGVPTAPVLTWNVSGGGVTGVHVYGGNLDGAATSGSTAVCPGTLAGTGCRTVKGIYTYTLDVFGAGGVVLAHRVVNLTIEP